MSNFVVSAQDQDGRRRIVPRTRHVDQVLLNQVLSLADVHGFTVVSTSTLGGDIVVEGVDDRVAELLGTAVNAGHMTRDEREPNRGFAVSAVGGFLELE